MTATTNNIAYEPTTNPQEWEEFYEGLFDTPEDRAKADREVQEMIALRQILMRCEEARERAGLSKAALARTAGVNPTAMRRLFTAEGSNPTFKTMIGILAALNLELVVKPTPRRRQPQATTRQANRARVEA